MKYSFKRFIGSLVMVLFLVCLNSTAVLAQPFDPSTPDGVPDYDPDAVPIDGGAGLLIAAGVAYGLKKIHDKKKAKDSDKLA